MDRDAHGTQSLRLAYYVSGHGFGHATRVSAIVEAILTVNPTIDVCIVSTAPSYVFNCLSKGASYRYSQVDPVIVQPVAYAVDRRHSLEVLRDFLYDRTEKLQEEALWLRDSNVDCVLSDAVFLACAAANLTGIPSALITNFTFDSNWSWLASDIPNDTPWAIVANLQDRHHLMEGIPDDPSAYEPLAESDLAPLVEQMRRDYSCADALFLLPGAIPFPSFSKETPLPATQWVSPETKLFIPHITTTLRQYREAPGSVLLHPPVPFGVEEHFSRPNPRFRCIVPAPLIVRHTSPEAFTISRRNEILDSVGVPAHLRDSSDTRILIVSFGGQKFRRPGSGSVTPSTQHSPESLAVAEKNLPDVPNEITLLDTALKDFPKSLSASRPKNFIRRSNTSLHPLHHHLGPRPRNMSAPPRFVTPTHLFIPGAPGPIPNPASPIVASSSSQFAGAQSSPLSAPDEPEIAVPCLLPPGWIAIICGASPDWKNEENMPEDLFLAPRDIYMPDLMVVGDVLLGKLGYGTVSEAIDSATPFMYVPRPAILEEMGLKLLLEQEGVGVEISREKYESGDWADLVAEAWEKGQTLKEARRTLGSAGREKRVEEAKNFAQTIVGWIADQQRDRVIPPANHDFLANSASALSSGHIPSIHVNC